MKQHRNTLFMVLTVCVTWFLAGCGYHFPGSQVSLTKEWQNSVVQVTGDGVKANPQWGYMLRDKIESRLGISGGGAGQGDEQVTTLNIILEPQEHTLVVEDRYGRGDQYRVFFRAKPVIEGVKGAPTYAMVESSATYYEPSVSTYVHATRRRAESEALQQLADSLVAILGGEF